MSINNLVNKISFNEIIIIRYLIGIQLLTYLSMRYFAILDVSSFVDILFMIYSLSLSLFVSYITKKKIINLKEDNK